MNTKSKQCCFHLDYSIPDINLHVAIIGDQWHAVHACLSVDFNYNTIKENYLKEEIETSATDAKNLDFNNEYSSLNDFPPELEGKDLLNEAEKVTYGFGLAIKGDLQVGTSGPCATFRYVTSYQPIEQLFNFFLEIHKSVAHPLFVMRHFLSIHEGTLACLLIPENLRFSKSLTLRFGLSLLA